MMRIGSSVRVVLAASLLCMSWVIAGSPCARADGANAVLLIVSQPEDNAGGKSFVDISPYVARNLQEAPGIHTVTYAPGAPEVQAAITAGKLTAADVAGQLTPIKAHKICDAIGASRLLRMSAGRTKAGIAAHATLEVSGEDGWKQAFEYKPSAPIPVRGSILDVIYAHAGAISKGVMSKVAHEDTAPSSAPANPKVGGAEKPGDNPATPPAKMPVETKSTGTQKQGETPVATPPPATATNPDAALALVLERYRERHDDANVIVTLRRAVNERPRDASLRRQLAEAYSGRGMSAAAHDEELRAVSLAPNDGGLHRLLGDGYMENGEIDNAIREYQTAVKLGGTDAANHVALGDAYWNSGKAEDALKCYADAAKADPASALPHRRLARTYALRGKLADCLEEMKLVRKLIPSLDSDAYKSECVNVLKIIDTSLQDGLSALQSGRKDIVAGTRTREQIYGEASATKKRAQETVELLSDLPAAEGFDGIQGAFGQVAALVAQAADSFTLYLETQSESSDQQTTLLRLEARRQLDAAEERLKVVTTKKPSR
jgi:hypothetical protein